MKINGVLKEVTLTGEGLSSARIAIPGTPPQLAIVSLPHDQAVELTALSQKTVTLTIEEAV